MDKELVQSKVVEIKALHQEVLGSIKMTLEKVIQIGRLLTECKKEAGYGKWMTWVEDNHESLGFGYSTANNYINCFERQDDPKFSTVENLKDIYYPKQIEHKEPELPKEPVTEEPEPLPVRLQPYVKEPQPKVETEQVKPEIEEPEIEEPEIDEQDELVEDIKDIYMRLDEAHQKLVINWMIEYEEERRAA